MTIARCRQVNIETTPYYHVIGRCVRRAFLCGLDASSGKNYEHRRQWVIQRLELWTPILDRQGLGDFLHTLEKNASAIFMINP